MSKASFNLPNSKNAEMVLFRLRRLKSWLKRLLAGFLSNLPVSHWVLLHKCAMKCSDMSIFPVKLVIMILKSIKTVLWKQRNARFCWWRRLNRRNPVQKKIWAQSSQFAHFWSSENWLSIKMYIFSPWKCDIRAQRTRKPIDRHSNKK